MSSQVPPSFESEPPSARQVEDLLYPHRRALAALMHSEALSRGDVAAALRLVTEVASQVLRVERASVWQFQSDRSALDCKNLFERSPGRHSQSGTLPALSYPKYFAALDQERSIAAVNAFLDPRTSEFGEAYLKPHGISAMLDAPVFVRGTMVGVVCHEHVGGPRSWLPWEELVAGSIADFVALALEAAERNAAEQNLKMHQQHLELLVAERTALLTATNQQLEREIADRQVIEERLRHSEKNLRTLFEVSPVSLVLTSAADQHVMVANRQSSELFGVPLHEAVGKRAQDFYVDSTERMRLVARVREEGHVHGYEAVLKTQQGREFPALISAQRLIFDGEPALLVSASDITEQKAVEARLRELATIDSLTGCYNRRHFRDVAATELERASRYGRVASVAMLDADHFKEINDTFGHDTGDLVLSTLADCCRRTLRKTDVLGRFGGEEFAILFVETALTDALLVAERVLARVAELDIQKDGVKVQVTLSAGVVERHEGEGLEAVLKRADSALYRAKEAGRNRVVSG